METSHMQEPSGRAEGDVSENRGTTGNGARRNARRQSRGLQRASQILDAAAQVFAEVGFDKATTIAIAARAGVSPGSLYQFFPHKEAIARALMRRYAHKLLAIHADGLSLETAELPLSAFLDRVIDPIVAFNRANPGLLALAGGESVSPQLARIVADLHDEVIQRLDAVLAVRMPEVEAARRQRMASVSLHIALALLPLAAAAGAQGERGDAMVDELKAVLHGYLDAPTDRSRFISS